MHRGNDTAPEARRVQIAAYRAMSGSKRFAIAAAMSEEARMMALAAIRRRYPDLSKEDEMVGLRRVMDLAADPRSPQG